MHLNAGLLTIWNTIDAGKKCVSDPRTCRSWYRDEPNQKWKCPDVTPSTEKYTFFEFLTEVYYDKNLAQLAFYIALLGIILTFIKKRKYPGIANMLASKTVYPRFRNVKLI